MMDISIDLTDGDVVPAVLYTVTRVDGTVERMTPHEANITVGANTWTSMGGMKSGVLTQRSDGTPPALGMEITLTTSGKMRFVDVDRGKYERADILVELTDANDPVTTDFLFHGKMLGTVAYNIQGEASFDLISKFAIPREILVSVFKLQCDYSFGDPLTCRVPTFPYDLGGDLNDAARNEAIAVGDRRRFRYGSDDTPEDYENVYWEATGGGTTGGTAPVAPSSTVGATVSDGGVTWTVRNSYVRAARISATDGIRSFTLDRVPDPRASVNTWYQPFKIKFWDGEYAGRVFRGSNWDAAAETLQVYLPCPHVAVNDWIEICIQCDQTYTFCHEKVANAANHGGYPFQLGAKAQAQTLTLT